MPVEDGREFWSFRPLMESEVPDGGIDGFVEKRLSEGGMEMRGEAEARDLLRRLWFDLNGLPPSAEELRRFASGEVGYEAVVDRLLASEAFGETWGRHWLDVARYADSNGGDINFTFYNAWRYRDYVIDAFNADKPYSEFVREQVSGDLMPWQSREERSERLRAAGFLVIGSKMTSERDKEKMVLDIADEQVDTVGRAFLGMTLGCARCHDHKFDPVPADDYYAMAGVFTSTRTAHGIKMGMEVVSGWNEEALPMAPGEAARLQAKKERLKAAEVELKKVKGVLAMLKDGRMGGERADFLGVVVDDSEAVKKGEWKPSTYMPSYFGRGYVHDDKLEKGEKSLSYRAELPGAGEYEVRVSYNSGAGRAKAVPVRVKHAGGEATAVIDQSKRPSVQGLFEPVGRWVFDGSGEVVIETGGTSADLYVIADAVQFIPVEEIAAERELVAQLREANMQERIDSVGSEVKGLEKEIGELKKAVASAPAAMTPRDRDEVGDLALRIRGEPADLGEVVPRGFLSVLPGGGPGVIPDGESGRLQLAAWLVSNENALTWRVIVNRVWHHLFGAGLVRSVDNFGVLGEPPSHPELLEYLALRFRDGGQSVKALVKEIVMSRAYRQSSRYDEAAWTEDPDNRLLWRQNRKRLTAEAIRDSMLAISGELEVGQPEGSPVSSFGEVAIGSGGSRSSSLDVEGLTCRSVYLPMVRADKLPVLSAFDFAEMEMVVGDRPETNVPAQALFFMNSRFVRERADAVAEGLMVEGGEIDLERVYWRVLGRGMRAGERERAEAFVEEEGVEGLVRVLFSSTEYRMLE